MFCYYCGLPADSIDHVVPQSILEAAVMAGDMESYLGLIGWGRTLIVKSCRQCNSLLGASLQHTLAERKAELKARLKRKLARDLNIPDWTEVELEELGPRLRQVVTDGLERKHQAQARLRW